MSERAMPREQSGRRALLPALRRDNADAAARAGSPGGDVVMRAAVAEFAPTMRTFDPPEPVDELGEAVLRSLSRAPVGGAWWRLSKAVIAGAFSLGLWPLLVLPRRFALSSLVEAEQAWYTLEWLR